MSNDNKKVTRVIPIKLYFPRGQGCTGKCTCVDCEKARSHYRQVQNTITIYRQACRKGSSVLFLASAAGSEIVVTKDENIKIIPTSHEEQKTYKKGHPKEGQTYTVKIPDSKTILEATFQKTGAYHGYAMRDWLKEQLGNLRSDVADCAREDIVKVWQAADAEFPSATREYLCLNGARRVAQFNGIGIPIRTNAIELTSHTIKFSFKVGEWLEAKIGTLDGSRWGIFKKIQSGEWKMGDPIRLNYKDGEIIAFIAYSRPPERISGLDPSRELECAFADDREKFIQFKLRDGQKTLIDCLRNDSLNANGAISFIDKLSKQTERVLGRLKSCGSRTERKYGAGNQKAHDAISDHSKRISKIRTNGSRTWNHTWSHRVISVAKRWSCSRIKVFDIPETLFGRPWQFADFKSKLEYKAKECGIKLDFVKSPSLKEIANAG